MYINLHLSALAELYVLALSVIYVQSNSGNSGAMLLVDHLPHVIYLNAFQLTYVAVTRIRRTWIIFYHKLLFGILAANSC